ncbi:TPA: type IV secretion system protein TraC, partial [Escherichia coli]
YGRYFNSDEPSLRDDAKMVVLELGGLEDRPSLLVAVMFSLIIYIENRMYRTPRTLKKLNVIDEGWRLLDFKNRKVGEFIQKGYRTCRRHTGAYITITQNIVDFDSDKASSAARAAWGNSSYKIILKQSAKEFAKYNQLFPDQFQPLQRDMIGKFGAAKDQWFSSFLLQVENHSSWHRLFVDPLSRAMYSSDGPDFEFVQQKRREGMSIHEAVWQLAWKKSGPEMASLEAWLEEHEKYRSVA